MSIRMSARLNNLQLSKQPRYRTYNSFEINRNMLCFLLRMKLYIVLIFESCWICQPKIVKTSRKAKL